MEKCNPLSHRMNVLWFCCFLLLYIMTSGCQSDPAQPDLKEMTPLEGPLFESLSPNQTGVSFRNDITESPEIHGLQWDAIYYGGGVGIGDIDNDGLDDIFLAGNQSNDALYKNKGNMKFEDISVSSGIAAHPGWSTGVAMVDINADGWLDIYVSRTSWKMDNEDANLRRNKLFINQKDGTFTEEAAQYGLDNDGYTTQATFFDADKDGDLDMYILNSPSNNLTQKVLYGESNTIPEFTSDRLFINENGKFVDRTKESGMIDQAFGLGVIATDLDHDTWVDIYIANDYDRPDFMYINQRDGTFKNQLDGRIKHTSFTSMGCDAADINNDGLVDLAVLDMQAPDHVRSKTNMPSMDSDQFWSYVAKGYNYQYMSNVLQLNNGIGFFSEIAQYAGIASSDWSWAVLMQDFDFDSRKDIYITNGINKDLRNNDFTVRMQEMVDEGKTVDIFKLQQEIPSNPTKNFMYRNEGDFSFSDVSEDWGLGEKTFSFGAAYGDLDNDGDIDMVVNNNNAPTFIYNNKIDGKRNSIKIEIEGSEDNPFGWGTKVFLFSGDDIYYQELNPIRGFQSTCGDDLIFGLGGVNKVDSLICIFPDDRSIKKYDVSVNKNLKLSHDESKDEQMQVYRFDKPIFARINDFAGVQFAHKENAYDDFKNEVLLPHAQSTRGPYQAVGDVNGDGLNDFYIGGASGQPGKLFVQKKEGGFEEKLGPWEAHERWEDMGCAFFDMEGDGDLDLYISSGGNASQPGGAYQDRIYQNTGDGEFIFETDAQPEVRGNASCVEVYDFDGDGDDDIFVGGLVAFERYPYPGESYLLKNEGGEFIDVTEELAPGLKYCGVVTDAVWADANDDNISDLIVIGEWMAPRLFLYDGSKFSENENWLENPKELSGWYQHINSGDINGDGKDDFMVGNFGTNNKYHPSTEKPLKVYSMDFDRNNTNDIVLAKKYKGEYVPVRGRECSSEQMPFVAEKFKTYQDFAQATIETIFEESLGDALELEVQNFESGVLLSQAEGYQFIAFPAEAQFFPVMHSLIQDFDKDGYEDVLLIGNLFEAEVETTRHDSGNGLFLSGDGSGKFEASTFIDNGFYVPYNARSLAAIEDGASGGFYISVGINNNVTLLYHTQ